MKVSDKQIVAVAKAANIEPAALRAVALVESLGDGFLPDGRQKILFEGHVFWRQLVIAGINPKLYLKGNEDVLYEVWDRTKYKGGAAEYTRLEKAMKINKLAALKSASYGMFQIMGFNHKACGFAEVSDFVTNMQESEANQLTAVIKLITANNWIKYLQLKAWSDFAFHYNGARYAENHYDTKLQTAYNTSLYMNTL